MSSKTKSQPIFSKTLLIERKDGSSELWTWQDETKKKLISVELQYPKGYDFNENHDKYINPSTGKIVSKYRAYQLGLTKNE